MFRKKLYLDEDEKFNWSYWKSEGVSILHSTPLHSEVQVNYYYTLFACLYV